MRTLAAGVVALSLALGSTINSARPLPEQSPPAPAAAGCAAPTLGAGVPSTVGRSPVALVAADFNDDGILDLASANVGAHSVSVILGGAGGVLGPAATIPVGQSPTGLATADFNGDARPDLAVANSGDYVVSVLLGTGAGAFQSTSVSIPFVGRSIAAADFTGDAHDDIVVMAGNLVALLAGDGAGGFAAPRYFSTPWPSGPLATGDFNGDGRLDLATVMANPGGAETLPGAVAVLLADASGGFAAAASFPVGRLPGAVAVGDFNADGRLDLAVVNAADKTVSVLPGDGGGGFAPQLAIGVGGSPTGATIADANLDGFPDIVVSNVLTVPGPPQDVPMGVLQIIPGDGSGGFGSLTTSFAGEDPTSPIAGDFDRDGRVDLAIADRLPYGYQEGQVGLLLNTCGDQADVSVAMSGSADPVPPYRGEALTLTADVTNQGPQAVPVVLRLSLVQAFTIDDVTVTQGRCRPGTPSEPFDQGTLDCWLGTLPPTSPGNTARLTLTLMTQWPGTHLSTARAFSGAFDSALSDNFASVTTRVGFMGGSNLRLRYTPGDTQVTLEWSAGDFQTGYYVARYVGGTRTILPEGAPLTPTATSFADPAPIAGQVNCYILGVLGDGGAVVGSSNGLCVQPGSASGTPPSWFYVADYGPSSVQLVWSGPGGQTGYVLVAQPLNGDPQRRIQLGPSKTSYVDSPPGVATCYVLAPYNGTVELGRSDKFCLAPGSHDYDW